MRNYVKIIFVIIHFFVLHNLNAQQWGDYTLYSVTGSSNAFLVDTNGTTYHTWTFTSNAKTGYSTYMIPGGTLVRTVQNTGNVLSGGGITGRVQKVDYNGNVTWDFTYSTSTYCLHHDICPLPNGNVLMISYDVKTAAEATQAGCSQNIVIWSEKIIEVQPTGATTGSIVWEWKFWDHLCQNYNSSKDNYVSSIVQNPQLMNINYSTSKDWIHMNGIDYNSTLDHIAISSHNMNEIYIIDHSTSTTQAASHSGGNSGKGGDFLYRWGNPAAYGATGTKIFNVVHDAHWIPYNCPKGGYLGAFNNKGGTGNKSCIDFFQPPLNGYNYNITLGSAYTPSTYAWRHIYSGSASQDMGNSQHLPNGNILVCIAMSGYIYEIDSNQNVLWSKSAGGTVAQAFRYTKDYLLGTLSVTASSSKLNACVGDTIQLFATPSTSGNYTYNWSSIPAGFISSIQNPYVTPTTNTSYNVSVSDGINSTSSTVNVVVNSLPSTPSITQNGESLVSSLATSYQWYNNNILIQGATNQSFTPTQSGNYQVKITNASGCTSMSLIFYFNYTGINNFENKSGITIYPNPTNGKLFIDNQNKYETCKIIMFDTFGKKVIEKNNITMLDISDLNTGIYFINIYANGIKMYSQKVNLVK